MEGKLTTEQGFDRICKVLPLVRSIYENDEVKKFREKRKNGTGTESDVFDILYPAMMGGCRAELYEIAALYSGLPAEEVKKQPFSETVKLFASGGIMEDLLAFFPSFAHMALMR